MKNANVKVAYDVSLLGAGYISHQSRTGIFRVLEEVLLELNRRSDVSVHSVALNKETTLWDDISSFMYFRDEQPNLLSAFNRTYYSRLHIDSVYSKLVNIQKRLIDSAKSRRAIRYKAGRFLQIVGSQIARREALESHSASTYDVYHGSYSPLPNTKVLNEVPRILTIYDLIPVLFPKFVIPKVHKRAIAQLNSIDIQKDWIICISEHTKRDFCQYTGMDSARVFVTPLAAASYFYPVKDSSCINKVLDRCNIPRSPYVLSLCTLEPRKNIELLIHAFSDLVELHPAAELNLVLVGVNGWKNEPIFEAVQSNPLVKDRVFFTGYLPDEDLAPIYSGALMFVYPSLYEGFGLPPLEAMQCGTPVIVSNTSSLPEVVGDAGILIDPTNKDELHHAMWKLMNDERSQKELSQRSIARASQFTWEKSVDKTVEVYRTVVGSKKLSTL